MRIVVALACLTAIAAAGCGASDEESASVPPRLADLTVTVDPDGTGAKKARRSVVQCDSAADSRACRQLADIKPKTFQPVSGKIACTELYGGPQVATVKGTLRGETIDAKFSRVNGCEISRWNDAAGLLGAAG